MEHVAIFACDRAVRFGRLARLDLMPVYRPS